MLHYNPQHVWSSTLLIFRRTNCITTVSGIVTLCKQPYSMPVESGLQSALHVFFYLTEQHSKFLWHTLEVLYMCTLCDSTNINTKIEFVPNCLYHVSGDGFNGGSDFSAPSGEMYNYCTPHIIKENLENFLIHRCKYILLSQVYCVWQVVKTPDNHFE